MPNFVTRSYPRQHRAAPRPPRGAAPPDPQAPGHHLRTEGAQTMFQDGLTKVLDGRVAYDELVRVTEPDQAWLDGHDGPAAPAPPALSLPPLTIVPRS